MMWLWVLGLGVLIYYLVRNPGPRPAWLWVVVAVLSVPFLGMTFMMGGHTGFGRGGMMGGRFGPGMMGGGQFGPGMMGPGAGGYGGHMGAWGAPGTGLWWAGTIVRILVVAALILVAIWAVRRYRTSRPDSEMAALRQRLIQGEITPEEFDRIKQKLQEQ